jgi:hypothetical protein
VILCAVGPGGVFVVDGAGLEAAVEDADESVAGGVEGLVVEVAGGAVVVVEGSGAGAAADGAEGLGVDGVVEAPVAHVAGQDGTFAAGGDGQR